LSVLCAALVLAACSAPANAGSWKFERDGRDHPMLSYSDNGKLQFLLGCGRALGLHVKYPGTAAKSGKASITIASGRASMKLRGEFQEPGADEETTFLQWDLGFSRQDPELFGKRWKRVYLRLLDLIGSGQPLVISNGKESYRLPTADAAGWKEALAECG
jgi:hypothetical protein